MKKTPRKERTKGVMKHFQKAKSVALRTVKNNTVAKKQVG